MWRGKVYSFDHLSLNGWEWLFWMVIFRYWGAEMIIFGRIEVTVRICVIIFTPSPAASFSPLLISKNAKHVGANIYVLLVFLQSIIYLWEAFCAGGMSPSLCLQQMLSAVSRLANIMTATVLFAFGVYTRVSRFYVVIFYLLESSESSECNVRFYTNFPAVWPLF